MASIYCGLVLLALLNSQAHGIPMLISFAPAPFNGTNPLFPNPSTFQHEVKLTYRSAHDVIGPVCDRKIEVGGSVVTVDVAKNPSVYANQVRVRPQIEITEPPFTSGGMYTLVLASQPLEESEFGSPTKPIIHWILSDIEIGPTNSPLTISYFVPFMPARPRGDLAVVMLYQQNSNRRLVNATVIPYVDNDCVVGPGRCSLDLERFANESMLTLVFGSTFTVLPDQFSLALHASLPFVEHGCYWLDKYEMKANVLLAGKVDKLEFGITAKFITPEEVIGPVCTRVFHYMKDEVTVSWDVGKPVPARKVRTIPWVEYGKKGEDKSWKDDWYTLAYVSQVTDWPEGGNPEKPLLLWLVTNIHGNDVSGGMCDVPYFPATPGSGSETQVFLLFKQKRKVDINPADFSESNCELQYRCTFNVHKMAMENEMMLVGAQAFKVAADPHSVITLYKEKFVTEQQACPMLYPFSKEGKMLGQCLPKFSGWAELWHKFQKSKEEEEKNMMKSKLSEMCPELGEHFSKDKPFHGEMKDNMEKMKNFFAEMMNKYKSDEKREGDGDMKKVFTHMLMEKMFKQGDKMDDKMEENTDEGCGKELIHQMMKMKMMWAMKEMNWEDREKEFGPCLKAVVGHLKALHEKYSASKEKEDNMEEMKEKFHQSMKEKLEGFVKQMVMSKLSEHLGMDSCGEEEDNKPCADPEKIKKFLWHKYVQMKESKQGGKNDENMMSMERDNEGSMEDSKKQFKEMMFFKSILSMMEKKDHESSSEEDSFPLFSHFLKNNPDWKEFTDGW